MKKIMYTILIIIGAVVALFVIGIFLESYFRDYTAHMDSVATVQVPNFIEVSRDGTFDVKNDSVSHDVSYVNYFWQGKVYHDFEGGVNVSPWRLIITIYEDTTKLDATASYIGHSAGGLDDAYSSFDPSNSSPLSFSEPTSGNSIDIQTTDHTFLLPHTFSIDKTPAPAYVVLLTDHTRGIRVLLSVPQDSFSKEDAIAVAQKTLSSISLNKDELSAYFKQIHVIPKDYLAIFGSGKATVQDVLELYNIEDLKRELSWLIDQPDFSARDYDLAKLKNTYQAYLEAYKSEVPTDTSFISQVEEKLNTIKI